MTTIGLAGSGPIAALVARRLAKKYVVRTLDIGDTPFSDDSMQQVDTASDLAKGADIVVLCSDSDAAREALLKNVDWLASGSAQPPILVDMSQGDPDETKLTSKKFSELGVAFVDAPLHTENTEAIEQASAIFCGGPTILFESLRVMLETVCPTVLHCGEVGSGHAMRLVVSAIAVCNRLITYECAAMGARNGLSLSDMATVLNKSSGYNSASARVLPALASDTGTANISLGSWANDLRKASAVAMRYGAPMLIATMARSTLDAASNRLGESSNIDKLAEIWKIDGGLPASNAS